MKSQVKLNLEASKQNFNNLFFKGNFPTFKRLHGGAFFCESLPMTASGKIKKLEVKKIAVELFKSQEINGNY